MARSAGVFACLCLAITPSALLLNELPPGRSYTNRRRAGVVDRDAACLHRPRMLSSLLAALRVLRSIFASRADLVIENLALRQQLAVLQRKHPRPRLRVTDRLLWLALRRWWRRWEEALAIVRPATVIRWHREGFKRYWRWRSRRCAGRPTKKADIRALVRRMAAENPTWGAPRIHGEIQKLGLEVSERTVSRYMPRRPANPDARQRWCTFLANHREVIAAMDFFTVPTVTFRVLYVFFVIHHARRVLVHFRATEHPTAAWITQQLREAFPYDQAPRYLILDRDAKYGNDVLTAIGDMGIRAKLITARSPWQNGVAERFVSTARRDLLDHVIVLNEKHLHRLLASFRDYYLDDRTHLSLEKDAPAMRAVEPKPYPAAKVIALPRLGGLHHRYGWRHAA